MALNSLARHQLPWNLGGCHHPVSFGTLCFLRSPTVWQSHQTNPRQWQLLHQFNINDTATETPCLALPTPRPPQCTGPLSTCSGKNFKHNSRVWWEQLLFNYSEMALYSQGSLKLIHYLRMNLDSFSFTRVWCVCEGVCLNVCLSRYWVLMCAWAKVWKSEVGTGDLRTHQFH